MRVHALIMAGLIMLAASLATGGAPRYTKGNDYRADDFPAPYVSRDFTIPLEPGSLLLVYPPALEPRVGELARTLGERLGIDVPARPAAAVSDAELAAHHLIVLGNIMDNPRVLELYRVRRAYADAYFPGPGGVAIHPVGSIWNAERNAIVVGVSRDEDWPAALEALLEALRPKEGRLGAVRLLRSPLRIPAPPASIEATLTNILEQPWTVRPPYANFADYGMYYHVTGDPRWAAHFLDSMRTLHARAERNGHWITEPWSNIYFAYSKLILAWSMIDDDPFFSAADRRLVDQVMWSMLRFTDQIPYLDPENAPLDEMRQNHSTFMGLSLFYGQRYFAEKYGLQPSATTLAKIERAFERGQAHSHIPNDDAGSYLNYAPLHTFTYMMATGQEDYLAGGLMRRSAELIASVIDNRGEAVGFGDVGNYRPTPRGSWRGHEQRSFSLAAWVYGDSQMRWLYDWIGGAELPSPQLPFSIDEMYTGSYAANVPPQVPERMLGVRPARLDETARRWIARRSWGHDRLPRQDRDYFHKLTFRTGFDAMDEYLLLDGLSTFSHGHHDGNSVLRLTWNDRIWLFDLDYIKYTPKFHSGVTIAREGVQEEPPPLTDLDYFADFDDIGASRTSNRNWNGADWERNILWLKGGWFLFLDQVRAREGGEFRLENRWRTRGLTELTGGRLRVEQGDQQFMIRGADTSPRRIEIEPDGHRSEWSAYPWGNAQTDILLARRDGPLAAGEDWTFANLLWAGEAGLEPPVDLLSVGENLWLVRQAEGSQLVGLDPTVLTQMGIVTDAAMFLLTEQRLHLFGLNRLAAGGVDSRVDRPVSLQLDLAGGEGEVYCSRPTRAQIGSRVSELPEGRTRFNAGTPPQGAAALLARLSRLAHAVEPAPPAEPLVDFNIDQLRALDIGGAITAVAEFNGTVYCSDDRGRLLRLADGNEAAEIFTTPDGAAITALAAADLDGDGRPELIAGDHAENLHLIGGDGAPRWQHKLTPFGGLDSRARDIHVDDIDGDGTPTILVANGGWKCYAIRPDGEIRWEGFVFYHPLTRVRVVEDIPGRRWVVAGTEYHTPVNVLDPLTGVMQWFAWEQMGSESKATTENFGIDLREMTFLDADDDGTRDIVFGTLSNGLYAIRAADGALIWEANIGDELTALAQYLDPATRQPRLLVGTAAGDLMVYDHTGRRLERLGLGAGAISSLLPLVHPESDRVDFVATTREGQVVVCDQELLVRAALRLDQPVLRVVETGREGSARRLLAVTATGARELIHQPYFLRRSWHY